MIAIVLLSISAVLAAIVVFIIVYYAIETRRQGFKIFWQKLEYFSSVISVDEEKVSFRPRGKDISNGQLDNIGLVGRTGSLALSGPYTIEDGIITRQILSPMAS